MSQENVEIVSRAWEKMKRGDLDGALVIHAPNISMDLTAGGRVEGGVYHGQDEIRRAYEIWASPWESMVLEASEFIDADDDQVVVCFESRGRSADTGLDFTRESFWVYELRDGRVVRIREFQTRQQALEAVGLRE
jgi:ketosteroid isomerase-like protein